MLVPSDCKQASQFERSREHTSKPLLDTLVPRYSCLNPVQGRSD